MGAIAGGAWVSGHWENRVMLSDEQPRFSSYTRAEVNAHNKAGDVWVTYKKGVYDITNFIEVGGLRRFLLSSW